MKTRLLSMLLSLCMALTMFPAGAFAAQPEQEQLYAQMLELGLVDGDGALIEDNSFTVEDGTRLSSLDELTDWLNQCTADELDTVITVDATGRTATAEQLMYALSIEYQMTGLAQTLSRLASPDGVSLTSAGDADAAAQSADTSVHDLSLYMSAGHNQDNDVLTIHASLRTKGGKEDVPAPHDIKLKIGMFADFLTPHQSDFYADGMPGGNFFKDFTISKGEKAVELNLSMDTLRGYLRDYEGHWDGYARVLIQARTAYDAAMPAGSKSVTVKFAADRDADAIVSAITGGTQIGRKSPSGTNVLPYQLDWQQHDSATEKVTINGTDYFKINTAVPAAKGYDYGSTGISNETHGWMNYFNEAIRLGAGDPDPKVKLANVTLWTKDGSRDIKPMSISIKEGEDLVKIARASSSYDKRDFSNSDDAAYLNDLARTQEENWDYPDPSDLNFYKQVKAHNWRVRRFTNVKVPITPTQSNYVSYPQDWYLPVSWIAQNDDKDIRPEEILMHGALTLADETDPTIESIDTCARAPKYTGSTDYWYSSFYPGDYVPIVVTFSEPVSGDYELAYLDGTETKYLSAVNNRRNGIPLLRRDPFQNARVLLPGSENGQHGHSGAGRKACGRERLQGRLRQQVQVRNRRRVQGIQNHRARQPAGRKSDRQLCFALRRNRPERPRKGRLYRGARGRRDLPDQVAELVEGRERAEGHGGAGRRPGAGGRAASGRFRHGQQPEIHPHRHDGPAERERGHRAHGGDLL